MSSRAMRLMGRPPFDTTITARERFVNTGTILCCNTMYFKYESTIMKTTRVILLGDGETVHNFGNNLYRRVKRSVMPKTITR